MGILEMLEIIYKKIEETEAKLKKLLDGD